MRLILFLFLASYGLVSSEMFAQSDSMLVSPPVLVHQDTVNSSKKPKSWKKSDWIIPSSLIAAGAFIASDKDLDKSIFNNLEVRKERNEYFRKFSTDADNYLQIAPAVAAFVVRACGIRGKNDLSNQIALFIKSELLMTAIVTPLKVIAAEPRPDTGARNSFPSGHTAQAFAAATFFAKEYGNRSAWYSVGAYTVATGVGAMRVLNNRHWLSDVIAGAGIGILSTNLVYATHRHKWGSKKNNQVTVTPTYGAGSTGLYMCYKF